MGLRRVARECALEILYEVEVKKVKDESGLDDLMSVYWKNSKIKNEIFLSSVTTFAELLVKGVFDKLDALDFVIKEKSKNWDLNRIAIIDKNIMRIAIYEIMNLNDIPVIVSINEAIEIAKKYASSDSDKYINGILDNIKREQLLNV